MSDANLAESEIKASLIWGQDLSPNLRKTLVQLLSHPATSFASLCLPSSIKPGPRDALGA
jgi:hypothetical protein